MYRYKRLKEELEDMDDHTCAPHSTAEGGSNNRRNSQEDPDKQERAVFHSQFSEEEFQRDLSARPKVTGPGGIFLPRLNELSQLVNEEGRVTVMCFTWNIACKVGFTVDYYEARTENSEVRERSMTAEMQHYEANRGLHRLNAVFAKIPSKERPDLIAVALQELPPSTFKFHNHVVEVVGEALCTTHRVYCWVRKWSQMFIIFIRKRLSIYTSHPEYKFIATNKVAKPFKTKGAIGICFRVLQTSCVFIACHLTHGQLKSRIMDYHKLSRTFDFDCLKRLPSSVLSPTTNNSNNPSNGHLNHSASPPPSITPKITIAIASPRN
uniref:Inositol polyphosphate-related phosphatase domain-containing protein n=1 Tax=Ditylenchus dipsaci TaxID=166011 RepID=A0A915DMA6_9BILA